MPSIDWKQLGRHRVLIAVTALQALCAAYFVYDVFLDMNDDPMPPVVEALAVLALVLGSLLGLRALSMSLEHNRRMEGRLRVASGAFLELLEESFLRWSLTPSERDVALLSIKGLSIAEIADLRRTRVGTVKAQCAAVYRKAGVSGRAELLSHFIEDLMSGMTLDSTRTLETVQMSDSA